MSPDVGATAADDSRVAAHLAAEALATVRLSSLTGVDQLDEPDPTEDYHEDSRLYRGTLDPRLVGAQRLASSLELRVSSTRSVKRHPHLPAVRLPPPALGNGTLAAALASRRSHREFGSRPIRVDTLGALLHAAYGVTASPSGTLQHFRTVPSGGALYPLELYVFARRVGELETALYHYDPLRHVLEHLRPLSDLDAASLTPYPELVEQAGAVVAISAMFWRSRFKYGARAYRFTLLEAGHVAQNLLLAAASLGTAALPLGGFYDRAVDTLLGIDGLQEATLYLLSLGSPKR